MTSLDSSAPPDPVAKQAAALNAGCIHRLYDALVRGDATACFGEEAAFEDIGFQLRGREAIGRMGDMVCAAKAFRAEYDPADIKSDATSGTGAWIAYYAPLAPGSRYAEVRNPSSSTFIFRTPGVIASQRDEADEKAWAEMAFPYPLSVAVGNLEVVRRLFARVKLALHRPRKT